MSDPYLTASAAAYARTGIALPGTPEGDALEVQSELTRAAHDLRRGSAGDADIDRVDALLRRAAEMSAHLAPAHQATVTTQLRQVSALRDAAVDELRQAGGQAPPMQRAPSATPRQRLEARLTQALRRMPRDPRAAAQHLGRAVHGHAASRSSLRALGGMNRAHLERVMDDAGVAGPDRQGVRDAVRGILGEAFHREVVGAAERAFARGVGTFERAARGGRDLDRMVESLVEGPNPYPTIDSLRNAGADEQALALRALLEETHVDPSRRQALRPAIRRAAQAAASAAAESLREYEADTFANGSLRADHVGLAYTIFPKAIAEAAQRQGVPAERAATLVDGHASGSTLLEAAAASAVLTAKHDQLVARRWAVASAVVGAVLVGTATAGVGPAVVGMGLEAPELIGALSEVDTTRRAAAMGLAPQDAIRDREVDRAVTVSAALLSAGLEGGAAATEHLAHRGVRGAAQAVAAASDAHALEGAARLPGLANHGRHELQDD